MGSLYNPFFFMKKKSFLYFGLLAVLAVSLSACSTGQETAKKTSSAETIIEAVIPSVLAQNENFIYEMYSEEAFNELKGNTAFAVFVHSKSCGTCAKKNNQILSEIEKFTDGKILKMEYSEAPMEFIKTYSVNKYDTFVMFDIDGNATTVKGASIEEVRDSL
jgi:hypothetical protein